MSYSHLTGSYTAPRQVLLVRLNALGEHLGKTINLTSGRRSLREQAYLYANRATNPYPVAPPTPNDPHVEGVSADATIDGQPIQSVVPAATLKKFGLEGLSGDSIHVQVAGTLGKSAAEIRKMAQEGRFKLRRSSGGGGTSLGDVAGTIGELALGPLDPFGSGKPSAQVAGETVAGVDSNIAGKVGEEVAGYFGGLLDQHAPALMLNLGLLGGGAFLVYYGAALLFGVQKPIGKLAEAGAIAAVPK